MCFLGTNDGKRFIAQPYQNVSLPWYAVAYDMLYGAFTVIQIAMALDMATFTLDQEPNGPAFPAGEPINVDVNIDTDTDVVTDVDTDVDVDVDIDTDVDVQPGMTGELLNAVGDYVMKELPGLLKEEAIEVALDSAVELLKAWQEADQQGVENVQPRQSTGLGLLVNYMLNEQNPVQARWQTFASFVQVSAPGNATVQMIVAAVLMTKSPATDTAAANWRWSTADQNAAVAKMTPFTGANTFQAFQALGAYTYNGQVLPVKVGAQVAMTYLKSTPAAA
jgi:hypothetical protein